MRRPGKRGAMFLPRPEYRLRRLVDAARLLPVFGGFLILLPILWAPLGGQVRATAWDGVYLFAAWAVLVGLAAWLAPKLTFAADDDPASGGPAATHEDEPPLEAEGDL